MNYVDQMSCVFTKFLFAFAQRAEMFIPLKTQVGQYDWDTRFFEEAEIWLAAH